MRLTCLFVVGIAALGCKDKTSPNTPPTPAAPARPGATPAAPAGPSPQAPEAPTLEADRSFDAEARDATWANATEQAVRAVAPQLAEVTCRQLQCRGTLAAASESDLMAAVDKLQADDSLHGLDGVKSIKLTKPEPQGGKVAMTIYVRFDRD
jgi:hypothetical protein